jgi:hypothetical protein
MSEFNACFVSYRHPNDADAKKFVQMFVKVLKKQLNIILPNATVFFDQDGLEVGDKFNDKLALQLCRSACLVICYAPRHFDPSHPYCTMEYLGMLQLEERRRERMQAYLDETGLIFPVVFRGFESLPAEVAKRECIKFDDVIKETEFKHGTRLAKIDNLARSIYRRWDEMERLGLFVDHDCSQFRFPEKEAESWLTENARRGPTRMPGR